MPLYEYILLALLTSSGNAPEGATLTLGPEAIVQPNGGELRIAKDLTPPKPDIALPKLNQPTAGKVKLDTVKAAGKVKFDPLAGKGNFDKSNFDKVKFDKGSPAGLQDVKAPNKSLKTND